ncbi:glycosyltransferase family 4 protein [Exiguobacterium sp. s157]|uniref:glycosyltransferase family 4 protein n=1 Tax=Exiguobacterium sp. s157 TaxID=2751233 RepID=UPI001BEAAD0A|nr:glycosyltransferase family 4 protein [Exiguobacterium sp. s157]
MKIGIITPGFLPVPAVKGGAIEMLITNMIEQNEKSGINKIDVYTISSPELNNCNFKHTSIIQIPVSRFHKMVRRIKHHYLKVVKKTQEYHIVFGDILIKDYLKDDYDYLLIENNMTLYKDIFQKTNYKDNLIFHLHNDIGSNSKPEYLAEFIGDTAFHTLTVSEYLKKRFKETSKSDNVSTFYNCVNIQKFNRKGLKNTSQLKKKYSINDNDIIFMYSGRIVKEKGIKELIIAFKEIQNHKNVKLMIVGTPWSSVKKRDPYFEELISLCAPLNDKVFFTGYIDAGRMPEIYGLADVVVIPSLCEEAFCVVALESMAMQIPLITTNSGGLMEVVDTNCAIIVEKEKNLIEALKKSMITFVKNKELRNEMGLNGYNRVNSIKEFDSNFYYSQFLNALSSLEKNN